MRTRLALLLSLGLLIALAVASCGADAIESEGVEGEPVEVHDLTYNVQLTRFLNPKDKEDAEYLIGLPIAPSAKAYLGVFLVVENDTDEALSSATEYTVIDTLDNEFDPIESKSPYALELGADVPADDQLPLPDSTPYAGFNKGSLLIFEVDQTVSENRPLELEIGSSGESGMVTLDI